MDERFQARKAPCRWWQWWMSESEVDGMVKSFQSLKSTNAVRRRPGRWAGSKVIVTRATSKKDLTSRLP
jgi:hypothetical protein